MKLILRTADLGDLGVIHAIRRSAILGITSPAISQAELLRWADRRSPEDSRHRVAAGEVVIAMSGENPVGWGSTTGDLVSGLYVLPSAGSRGVGGRILYELECRISRRGHQCARVESSPNAVGFYSGRGYEATAPPDANGAVRMRKPLLGREPKDKLS